MGRDTVQVPCLSPGELCQGAGWGVWSWPSTRRDPWLSLWVMPAPLHGHLTNGHAVSSTHPWALAAKLFSPAARFSDASGLGKGSWVIAAVWRARSPTYALFQKLSLTICPLRASSWDRSFRLLAFVQLAADMNHLGHLWPCLTALAVPRGWLREQAEEPGFCVPCLALTCYCCSSGSEVYKNGEHSWYQTLLLPTTLHTMAYSSAELSQRAFVHCWVVLDSLWLHYGLTLSTGEWKTDDVAVTLAVTQQGKGKDTALGAPLPIPHSFQCRVLLTECLALTSGALGLCCHEKQIAKLVFYNKLLLWDLSRDKLGLWQREAAGGPAEWVCFSSESSHCFPFPCAEPPILTQGPSGDRQWLLYSRKMLSCHSLVLSHPAKSVHSSWLRRGVGDGKSPLGSG